MYTRNQSFARQEHRDGRTERGTGFPAGLGGGMVSVLIPKDYHGEFLRERRAEGPSLPTTEDIDTPPPSSAFPHAASGMQLPVPQQPPEASDTVQVISDVPDTAGAAVTAGEFGGRTLFGGLYDLLIGETSTEEETLLLLAIGLLLLWGHLDRGGLFDRNTWDADDLALLFIGYLLLS